MSEPLTGRNLIGYSESAEGDETYQGVEVATNRPMPTRFHEATEGEVDRALELADRAFTAYRQCRPAQIASFLDRIAENITAVGDVLIQQAQAESGLPLPRLTGELGRTINQARLFAKAVREGSWVDARIVTALPDRKPLPRPDIRTLSLPIGPIVVFGASNFPLAISVAGCDTLSAFAVGCPVVVKAHPGHPATSERVARAILEAAKHCDLPEGVFSMVHGAGYAVGLRLVRHPLTQAVAFTGSERGGRALFDAAVTRPCPIPVYAEMGSTNPVFLLPGALAERGTAIAEGFVQSMTMGVGQFCTQPGIVLGAKGSALDQFLQAAAGQVSKAPPALMLNAPICRTFHQGTETISGLEGVHLVERAAGSDPAVNTSGAVLFETDVETFLAQPLLSEEVFGPSSIVVTCDDRSAMMRVADALKGQLTATIHGTPADLAEYADLVRLLERKAGRLVFNGFPTGIEVCSAMHHGGPYPATTDSHHTSIGTAALRRFIRPVCFQNFPEAGLPEPLQNANPRGIWRLVDDQMTRDAI